MRRVDLNGENPRRRRMPDQHIPLKDTVAMIIAALQIVLPYVLGLLAVVAAAYLVVAALFR